MNPTVPFYLPIPREAFVDFMVRGVVPPEPAARASIYALLTIGPKTPRPKLSAYILQAHDLFAADEAAGRKALLAAKDAVGSDRKLYEAMEQAAVLAAPPAAVKMCMVNGYPDFGILQAEATRALVDFEVPAFAPPVDIGDSDLDLIGQPSRETVVMPAKRGQAVAARAIINALDDRSHVSGMAGCGKTHLVTELHRLMGSTPMVYVAPYPSQLKAFRAITGCDDPGRSMSVSQFINKLSFATAKKAGLAHALYTAQSRLTPAQEAAEAGINVPQGTNAQFWMRAVRRVLSAWAASTDKYIGPSHASFLPKTHPFHRQAQADALSLWRSMGQPRGNSSSPHSITPAHVAKWLSLLGVELEHMGLLVVDEAHDLSRPLIALLDTHPGGVVYLSDGLQRVSGYAPKFENAKRLGLTDSVRQGVGVDKKISAVLQLHPAPPFHEAFEPNPSRITKVREYGPEGMPETTGLHAYIDGWNLLRSLVARLKTGSMPRVLPATALVLKRQLANAPTAYHMIQRGQTPNGDVPSWVLDLVADAEGWEKLNALLTPQPDDTIPGRGPVHILVEHLKNTQVPSIALSPCCFTSTSSFCTNRVEAAYLALTRAEHEVWLPGEAMGMLASTPAN